MGRPLSEASLRTQIQHKVSRPTEADSKKWKKRGIDQARMYRRLKVKRRGMVKRDGEEKVNAALPDPYAPHPSHPLIKKPFSVK